MDKDSGISQAEPLGLISRSISRVARQTQNALTPWVQRTLNRSSAPTTSGVSNASAEPVPRLGSLGMVGRRAKSFVERIQRKGWDSAVWNAAPVTDRVMRMDTFATGIVRRFPDVSSKYERTQTGAAAPSQQAAMPFQGDVQASNDVAPMPPMPTFDAPSSIQMSPSSAATEPPMSFQAMRERVQRAMSDQREQSSSQQPAAGTPASPSSTPSPVPSGLPPLGPDRA